MKKLIYPSYSLSTLDIQILCYFWKFQNLLKYFLCFSVWEEVNYGLFFFLFFNIFIEYAITVVPFPPPLHSILPPPPKFPPYSSCPWVILINSLASTFPTLFLPSPCLFSTCHLCYLFSVPFPPSPPPTPLLTTLHVISISMVLFLF